MLWWGLTVAEGPPVSWAGRPADVSQPPAEPAHLPPASGQQVRSHAAELVQLAARHGITALVFASTWPPARPSRRRPGPARHVRVPAGGRGPARRRDHGLLRSGAAQPARQPRPRHRHIPCERRPPGPSRCPEPEVSPGTTEVLRDEGDAARSGRESRYRWVLHRLWIAVGNEALAGSTADQDFGLAACRIAHMPK
jgi:hypothetical protein